MSDKIDPAVHGWIREQNDIVSYMRRRIESLEKDFELIKKHLKVTIVDIPAKRVVDPFGRSQEAVTVADRQES